MHPEIAKTLVAQHRDELIRHPPAAGGRPAAGSRAGESAGRGPSSRWPAAGLS